MLLDYNPFIDRVINRYEGGYGWNKKDPGGPTKYGITCYDLAEHRSEKMTSMAAWEQPVRDMPLEEAEVIYRIKYAAAIRFDDLPPGVDCAMLDYAINSGTARPIHVARALLGLPTGGMDLTLLDKIKKCQTGQLVAQMNQERLRFMHAIRGGTAWTEFGHGWGARVADLDQYCDALIRKVPPPTSPDLTTIVTPKATNVAKTATTATAGGAGATAGGMLAAGQPWMYAVGAAAAVVFAGIGYEIWQEHRAKVANTKVYV